MIAMAIGGFAYGFIEKTFPQIPTVPLLGKSGTIAAAAYFFGGSNKYVRDIGQAAAVIAGYSLGATGTISGEEYGDDEHGLAAEG